MPKKAVKKKKEQMPRKDFAQMFAEKLRKSSLGEVDEGALFDDSARWVTLKVGLIHLSFCFNMKGELITDIGLYKDILEVVDQKQILYWDKPKSE